MLSLIAPENPRLLVSSDAADRDVLAMMKEHARRRRGNAQQLAQRGSSQAVRPGAASLGPRGDAVRRADSAFKNHPVTFQSTAPATAAGVLREREVTGGCDTYPWIVSGKSKEFASE